MFKFKAAGQRKDKLMSSCSLRNFDGPITHFSDVLKILVERLLQIDRL